MAKYSKALVAKIVRLVEEDNFSLTEICRVLNISRDTVYNWKANKPEFAQLMQEAEERREEYLIQQSRKALHRKLNEYSLTETRTKYVLNKQDDDTEQLVIKECVVKEKRYAPDTSAALAVLSKYRKTDNAELKSIPLVLEVKTSEMKSDLESLFENFERLKTDSAKK